MIRMKFHKVCFLMMLLGAFFIGREKERKKERDKVRCYQISFSLILKIATI